MSEERYDVAIVGAGPAGAIAALGLARAERKVVLVDRAAFPRRVTCTGWISARLAPLLEEYDLPVKKLLSVPFSDVTFHDAAFSKTAVPKFADPPGYLVDRATFDHALVVAAKKAGAEVRQETDVEDVDLGEDAATLRVSGSASIESRLLVIAAGRTSNLASAVGFPERPGEHPSWTAQVTSDAVGKARAAKPKIDVVLGLDGATSFGLIVTTKERVTLDVNWFGTPAEAQRALANLCALAKQHQIVEADLAAEAFKTDVHRMPSSAALDLDSHVRKHTLLIGDAGGFVSAVSSEGIYPAIWSAKIAVDVLLSALDETHSQDALMRFDSEWRMQMADHLRSPHTDVRFLLPLVFSNQPMTDRMGSAFFLGDNI